MEAIINALDEASVRVYEALRQGLGLRIASTSNESGDIQIELDIFADEAFRDRLSSVADVRFVISEEQPELKKFSDGEFSVSLDPLDGSKSALVGIPSGAIFGIFRDVSDIHDFTGHNIVAGGFYVFGATLECYYSVSGISYKKIYQEAHRTWEVMLLDSTLPIGNFFDINVSNFKFWPKWLSTHYKTKVLEVDEGVKPANIRWYASMVSQVKRLTLQGGIFAYPNDCRSGYEQGHLRLVYEAIPMAYFIHCLGGLSSDGKKSLLEVVPNSLHQKTPVFLGECNKILELQQMAKVHN